MSQDDAVTLPTQAARAAGALYLVIIALGLWSEVAVRATLFVPDDPVMTAANIRAAGHLFRLSFAADVVMAMADAALAVVLFVLLRPVGVALALGALVFRLVQTAIIAANLLHHHAAQLALDNAATLGAEAARTLAWSALQLQGDGYDLGLIFFGINCFLTAGLLLRTRTVPRPLSVGVGAAGGVYLTGSLLAFLAPGVADAFAPAYLIPVLAESAFCLWLLTRGLFALAPPPPRPVSP